MCPELFISCHLLCCLSAYPYKTAPYGECNSLYIFTDYAKYEVWMKTSSSTPPWHIITCVQFNGLLVEQHYRKSKSMPTCTCFLHTEIPLAQWNCHIEAVYFKKLGSYQRKLHVRWNYSQAIFWFCHTYYDIDCHNTHSFRYCLFVLSGELTF